MGWDAFGLPAEQFAIKTGTHPKVITEKNVATIHQRLRALVDQMHARGVYHLDLRNRGNVLVDDSGRPTLLDFASSVMVRPDGVVEKLLRPLLSWWDRRGVTKWSTADAAQVKPDDWDARI
jgi:RIO-like serine/threonine protein kinase